MEWLIAAAILAGALPRMMFGIWADRFGGRKVYLGLLLFCAIPTYLFSRATTYPRVPRLRPAVRAGGELVHGGDLLELGLVPARASRAGAGGRRGGERGGLGDEAAGRSWSRRS